MSRILVRSGSDDLAGWLTAALLATPISYQVETVALPPHPGDPALLWRGDPDGPPRVLVLDCALGVPEALDLTARLDAECPAISVVLVTDGGPDLALPAMRAGATDILAPGATAEEVLRTVQRAVELAEVRSAQQAGPPVVVEDRSAAGQVISVVSPKGGVGKTTVATNLAVGLARSAPQATVLVDLDIQFGDVASGLNLDPEHDLTAAVTGQASRDTMVLKTFLTLHETGLYVICAPDSPVEAENVSADAVRQLLRTLASEFRYVVVDTAPGLSEHTLAAMDETTDLVLLSSMDVPGLRGLRKEIDTLRELTLLQRRHQVVINFADPSTGLTVADVEATIGAPVDLVLPRSKAAPASVNLGVPLLQSGVRDPMTRQLLALVQGFAPGPGQKKVTAAPQLGRRAGKGAPVPRRAASGWFRRPRAVAS
ncbi:CpaE family protein [Microlunatus capsulatus]|uniref:Pilus assembly protein CpaE n=1 Tax=Microlunatus capsulatus TaxID=99117 RepID=A0ABS4Z4U1_9ACTN|nr:AAA family ATPase [Microlunatus capsulatus]MBP2416016.1 pilus assembly protein CpaE [Microlunatus capsulatus]